MVIVDAIKTASSEHAVFFLVTAYVESLRHFRDASRIPEFIVRLPVHGETDLSERLTSLRSAADTRLEAVVAVQEASIVFSSALERLEAISCCA
jgi:hypothetical protein